MSEEEKQWVETLFKHIDLNQDESICTSEVRKYLEQSGGGPVDNSELEEMVSFSLISE